MELIDHCVSASRSLFDHPQRALKLVYECVMQMQQEILSERLDPQSGTIKENVHVRVKNMPTSASTSQCPRSRHYARLISFSGTVTKSAAVKVFVAFKYFLCTKCQTPYRSEYDVEIDGYPKPIRCTRKTDGEGECACLAFKPVQGLSIADACSWMEG